MKLRSPEFLIMTLHHETEQRHAHLAQQERNLRNIVHLGHGHSVRATILRLGRQK